MKCENCRSNEATVKYTENINGRERKLNLCLACAKKMESELGIFSADFFSDGLLSPMFYQTREKKESIKCPLCASDFSDIERTGKAGCPACYGAFEKYLASTLKKLHGASRHTGRKPARLTEKDDGTKELEAQLKAAIEKEEYEEAAALRDRIKELRRRGEA